MNSRPAVSASTSADYRGAARHFAQALDLSSSDVFVVEAVQRFARIIGRFDMAIALGDYLIARDRLCAACQYKQGRSLLAAGRLDEARNRMHTTLLLDPDTQFAGHFVLGLIALLEGDAEAALLEFDRESYQDLPTLGRALAVHDLGRPDLEAALTALRAVDDLE